MLIDPKILIAHGGIEKSFEKGQVIFKEEEEANYYYQISKGSVKMFNLNRDSKEFIQGIFKSGESFGEPPLFINEKYPASAAAIELSTIIRLCKLSFFKILTLYPDIQTRLLTQFAKRIYNKAITAKEIINNTPELRIMGFLKTYKKQNHNENEKILIPYTRQEIANFTGLRVETVIRTLSKMKDENKVAIINRKLVY